MKGTVTIDLDAAGLTHAKGTSDRCGGEHDIPAGAVTGLDVPGWISTDRLPGVLQALHERAHPRGTAYWHNCREPGCTDAQDLINGE